MFYFFRLLVVCLGISSVLQASEGTPLELPLNIPALREAFLKEHRVYEKVFEGKSQWSGFFCEGGYQYRVSLKTTVNDLKIDVLEDGSLVLKAVVGHPYIGFKGGYQGALSFCYPIENNSGLSVEEAILEAHIHFFETEEGRVQLKVDITSVELGTLRTSGTLSREMEEALTRSLNEGLSRLWSSHLGDWLSQTISFFINENLPINL